MVLEKFEENLVKLSNGDSWELASKEWGFIYKIERDTKDNNCLCGHKLKHQYYYYNKKTHKIICCGNGCKKHIDEHIGTIKYDNSFVCDMLYIMGTDQIVDYDLDEYCSNNEQKVFDRLMWRTDLFYDAETLDSFYDYVEYYWSDLIDVDIILTNINTKLQSIYDKEERLEKEKQLEKVRNELDNHIQCQEWSHPTDERERRILVLRREIKRYS